MHLVSYRIAYHYVCHSFVVVLNNALHLFAPPFSVPETLSFTTHNVQRINTCKVLGSAHKIHGPCEWVIDTSR